MSSILRKCSHAAQAAGAAFSSFYVPIELAVCHLLTVFSSTIIRGSLHKESNRYPDRDKPIQASELYFFFKWATLLRICGVDVFSQAMAKNMIPVLRKLTHSIVYRNKTVQQKVSTRNKPSPKKWNKHQKLSL